VKYNTIIRSNVDILLSFATDNVISNDLYFHYYQYFKTFVCWLIVP